MGFTTVTHWNQPDSAEGRNFIFNHAKRVRAKIVPGRGDEVGAQYRQLENKCALTASSTDSRREWFLRSRDKARSLTRGHAEVGAARQH